MHRITFKNIEHHETELLNQVYRLRLQVYGHECKFVSVNDYPDGLEFDEYDLQSLHFVALTPDQQVVAYLRLIFDGKLAFPFKMHCPGFFANDDKTSSVEISRFLMNRPLLRKYRHENLVQGEEMGSFLESQKMIYYGLYQLAYREAIRRGITRCCALMETGLWSLLRMCGIPFECVGEEVDVYGPVKPYVANIQDVNRFLCDYQTRNNCPLLKFNTIFA